MKLRRIVISLTLIGAVTLATPMVVMATILLMPTMLAWASDTTTEKPATRAVLLFGLAAAAPSLVALWVTGPRLEDALAMTLNLRTLAQCWAAQAAAWLIAQLIPILVAASRKNQATLRQNHLTERREALDQEWG